MQLSFIRHPESYTIGLSSTLVHGCFACISFNEKFTVIFSHSVADDILENKDEGWIMFSVDASFDFSLTGIISAISKALADAQIPVFVVSSFYTDHILVKREMAERTVKCFNSKNWSVKNYESGAR